jgi:predicted transcriptional regulator
MKTLLKVGPTTKVMIRELELSDFDLRYESCRMKNHGVEGRLLASIAERGIEEPLEGVDVEGRSILLNGFKRYRCAQKLRIFTLPYAILGGDEVEGMLNLLRISNNKTLGILEQAAFIDELKNTRRMGVAEIAQELSRSKSWVSMRLGLLAEMSETVRRQLFAGAFPVYAYMYSVRQFMRMNSVTSQQADEFVTAVGGKNLSIRQIGQLAHGYFRGPDSFREEILKGNLGFALKTLEAASQSPDGCSEFERVLLRDLEILQKYMQRVMGKSRDPRLQSQAFHSQCHLMITAILSRIPAFNHNLKQLYDRTGQA